MPTSFLYDVALSYVSEDSLTARHLMKRLQPRLSAQIFDSSTAEEHDTRAVPDVLGSSARVVVVLHQRLWGETSSTQRDLDVIRQRLALNGAGFLVVVALEPCDGELGWVDGTPVRTSLSDDGACEVDAIMAAVERAGGRTIPASLNDGEPAGGLHFEALDDDMAGRGALLSSFKIANAAQKEVAALMSAIEKDAGEIRASFPDLKVEVRRAPDRCVVQAGDVGLSTSWLHRSSSGDDGALLIIEWDGTVTFPGEQARRGCHASVAREHVLHLETVAWPAWNWSAADTPMRKYTSVDLASLCVQLIMRRLRYTERAIGTVALAT